MQKTLAILLLFLFFSFAYAEMRIVSYEILTAQPILEGTNKIDFKAVVENVGDAKTIDFNAFANQTKIHSEKISFDANQTKEVSFDWQTSEFAIVKGHYTIDLNIYNDANLVDTNSVSFYVDVYKGKNLVVLSLTSDKINYLPQETAHITGVIANNGDLSISEDFNACFFFNHTLTKCAKVNGIDVNQYRTLTVDIQLSSVPQTNTVLLVADVNNEVNEFNEADNNKSLQISTLSEIDLSVVADDISFSDAIAKKKMVITAKIKNLGSKDAQNVDVKVVIGEDENTGTLIYYNTFALIEAGSYKVIETTYTPPTEGYDVITVMLDPALRLTEEKNKQNNTAKRGFYIAPPEEKESEAYTFILETQETCLAMLSNNDRVIMDSIVDLNNGVYGVRIKVYDKDGVEKVNRVVKVDEEINLPGRTIRVLNAESFFARLLLVYQHPVSMLYNTCQTDIKHEYERSQTYMRQRDECLEQKSDLQARLNSCNAEKESILSNQKNYQNLYEECLLAKEKCNNALADYKDECQSKISAKVLEAKAEKDEEMRSKLAEKDTIIQEKTADIDKLEQEIAGLKKTIFLAQIGFALILLSVAGILLYEYRWKVHSL